MRRYPPSDPKRAYPSFRLSLLSFTHHLPAGRALIPTVFRKEEKVPTIGVQLLAVSMTIKNEPPKPPSDSIHPISSIMNDLQTDIT